MKGAPEIKRYMYKRLNVRMNSNRNVIGALKGYDAYMNMVLEDAVEVVSATEFNRIGTVVIRGNCIIQIECLDRLDPRTS